MEELCLHTVSFPTTDMISYCFHCSKLKKYLPYLWSTLSYTTAKSPVYIKDYKCKYPTNCYTFYIILLYCTSDITFMKPCWHKHVTIKNINALLCYKLRRSTCLYSVRQYVSNSFEVSRFIEYSKYERYDLLVLVHIRRPILILYWPFLVLFVSE